MESNTANNNPVFVPRHLPLQDLSVPLPGVAHLWFLDLVELGSPLQPAETISRDSFSPVLQRTVRRFYLRLLLGAYLDLPGKSISISREVRGKPRLDPKKHGASLDFSIAASDGCCLVAVTSEAAIGVDLELKDRKPGKPRSLARRYFSQAEVDSLESLPAELLNDAFLHTWACKEAMVKAAGHGIANRLCRFTVNVDPKQPPRVLAMDDDDPDAWTMAVFKPGKSHTGAVTVRYPHLALQCYHLLPPS